MNGGKRITNLDETVISYKEPCEPFGPEVGKVSDDAEKFVRRCRGNRLMGGEGEADKAV